MNLAVSQNAVIKNANGFQEYEVPTVISRMPIGGSKSGRKLFKRPTETPGLEATSSATGYPPQQMYSPYQADPVVQSSYMPAGASFNPQQPAYNKPYNPSLYNQPSGYGAPAPPGFGLDPAVANVAMQYSSALVGTGRQMVDHQLEKYVPVTQLKYYFAVDTTYVARKLMLLFFPFTHSDWSVKYEQNEPVQPRYEVNAPDLYIPTMAYVTYVLVAGLILGMQNRFSPEVLGMQASQALAYSIFEIIVELVTLYVTNIQSSLKTLDLLAYAGYKFVGIIAAVLLSLVFHRTGYYIGLLYCSLALAFFLVRTLKIQVVADAGPSRDPYTSSAATVHSSGGIKRRLYFLLFVAGIQPVLMWWLSVHLVT